MTTNKNIRSNEYGRMKRTTGKLQHTVVATTSQSLVNGNWYTRPDHYYYYYYFTDTLVQRQRDGRVKIVCILVLLGINKYAIEEKRFEHANSKSDEYIKPRPDYTGLGRFIPYTGKRLYLANGY